MAISTQTRITRARIQICMRKPYLSTALMRFPLVQADGIIETICTDGYHIFWSESFIDSLTDAELRGVLAHELMHVITQSADRRQERDKHLWNLATDYAINQVLVSCGFRLPGGALLSPLYRDLSAERIYELLEHKGSDNPPPLHSGGSQGQNKQRKDSRGRNKQREDSDECVLKDVGEDVLDPNSPEATRLRTLTGIEMPDEQEVDEAVEATRLETLKALRSAGITGGNLESLLQGSKISRIDWRTLLAEWMYDRIRDDWSTWPPSKKHICRGLYLPSPGRPAPIKLVMFVDTSGSMSDESLERIFGEIRTFRETFPTPFVIIQADAGIQSVDEYDAYEDFNFEKVKIHGRGGTEFISGYNWIEEHFDSEPVAIIHATDGWGKFPRFCRDPVVFLIPKEVEERSDLRQFPEWGRKIIL